MISALAPLAIRPRRRRAASRPSRCASALTYFAPALLERGLDRRLVRLPALLLEIGPRHADHLARGLGGLGGGECAVGDQVAARIALSFILTFSSWLAPAGCTERSQDRCGPCGMRERQGERCLALENVSVAILRASEIGVDQRFELFLPARARLRIERRLFDHARARSASDILPAEDVAAELAVPAGVALRRAGLRARRPRSSSRR